MLHWWQWYIKCCQLILFFILLKGRFPSHIRMLLKDQVPSHIREAIHSRADTAEASNSSLISVTFLGTLSVLDLENLPQEHGGLMTLLSGTNAVAPDSVTWVQMTVFSAKQNAWLSVTDDHYLFAVKESNFGSGLGFIPSEVLQDRRSSTMSRLWWLCLCFLVQ